MPLHRTLSAVVTLSVVAVVGLALFTSLVGNPTEPRAVPALRAVAAQTEAGSAGAAPSSGPLSSRLETLLGHHVTLVIRFMRATVSGDPGFVDTADAALVRNTEDLTNALAPAVGEQQALAFGELWQQQVQALFNYAAGVRDDDQGAKDDALAALGRFVEDQSTLIAELTDGRLSREEAARHLRKKVAQLTDQVDAYAAQDYERAYELQRTAYALMFPIGTALADATQDKPAKPTPTDQLSSALAQLLGEHVEIAIDAMRAGVQGAPEFEAAAGALNANTKDVAGAMDSLFGAERAETFNQLWADHINLFVEYTVAVAEEDQEAKDDVAARFENVINRFGTALADTTDGEVDADVVHKAMTDHERQLFEQIEVYADRRYGDAHDLSYVAYEHIRETANVLAMGFAAAVGENLPLGGPDTGGGATAGHQDGNGEH
jgi:uncharacterized phage infection (PIP) family protein YhgE